MAFKIKGDEASRLQSEVRRLQTDVSELTAVLRLQRRAAADADARAASQTERATRADQSKLSARGIAAARIAQLQEDLDELRGRQSERGALAEGLRTQLRAVGASRSTLALELERASALNGELRGKARRDEQRRLRPSMLCRNPTRRFTKSDGGFFEEHAQRNMTKISLCREMLLKCLVEEPPCSGLHAGLVELRTDLAEKIHFTQRQQAELQEMVRRVKLSRVPDTSLTRRCLVITGAPRQALPRRRRGAAGGGSGRGRRARALARLAKHYRAPTVLNN